MGWMSRLPDSNDPPRSREGESPYLEATELADETTLLINGKARRCKKCRRGTRLHYLDTDGHCPDCRENH